MDLGTAIEIWIGFIYTLLAFFLLAALFKLSEPHRINIEVKEHYKIVQERLERGPLEEATMDISYN